MTEVKKKVEQFFNQLPSTACDKGEIIIRAGESPGWIFYLQEGIVRQYSISKEGEEITLNLYKPHTLFPMMWAMNDTPNRYYFEAMAPITVIKSPREMVLKFIKDEPDVLYDLTSRLYKGIDGLLGRMEYLMAGNAQAKVIFTLLNAAYRFGNQNDEAVHIPLRMTHKDLATISGVTRETCTREIKKLEKKGILALSPDHTIILKNRKQLEQERLLT